MLDKQTHKECLQSFHGQKMTMDCYYGKAEVGKIVIHMNTGVDY